MSITPTMPCIWKQARMDLFFSYGLDILALEEEGVIMPLVSLEIRYLEPLHFGDQIRVETILKTENKFRLEIKYRIVNQNQKLVARAKTSLVFADKDSGKLIPGFRKYLETLTIQEKHIQVNIIHNRLLKNIDHEKYRCFSHWRECSWTGFGPGIKISLS